MKMVLYRTVNTQRTLLHDVRVLCIMKVFLRLMVNILLNKRVLYSTKKGSTIARQRTLFWYYIERCECRTICMLKRFSAW